MHRSLLRFALSGLLLWPVVSWAALALDPMAWLLLPLSGANEHHIAAWTSWHARLMVLGWGILLPLGALVARFFKVTSGQSWPQRLDNKMWWHAHRALQYVGLLVMTAGLWLAWGHGGTRSPVASIHAVLGWSLCIAGWAQVASGLLRGSKGGPTDTQLRGDHYDMTCRRLAFERLHKSLGWLAIVLAIAVIALGLHLADAPRWMAVVLCAWWLALVALFARWQIQGRCIDTYQAIWGPDETHPGNAIPPVGWGICRYGREGWRRRFGQG